MTVDLCFQFYNGTNFFSILLVNHRKGSGNFAYIHLIHHFRNILRQILHLELRSSDTCTLIRIHHKTVIITSILIL